jgi:ornithine--oxo-acid transaminase
MIEYVLDREGDVAAFIAEPMRAVPHIPPPGFWRRVRNACDRHGTLLIFDEIPTGLGKTGKMFAAQHDGVVPDLMVLGKALGGGILPVSAVVANRDVLGVIRPGEHGSTFGGNPLAAAVGTRVVEMLSTGEFQRRAAALGEHLEAKLRELIGHGVTGVRVAGLWAGVDIDPAQGTGRQVAERLLGRGVLVKDTHGQTIRIAPPLVIRGTELDWAVEQLKLVLTD